jgi:D-beta-D-heptose 7-phosphate kinase/D-beta-D-heptose 1-phosphate adenosyltransferase
VGLNSDASVRRLKGQGRPIQSELDRARILASLASVDAVVLFDEDTPLTLIEALRPGVLCKGADYARKEDIVGADRVESWGGTVERIEFVEGRSTTSIVNRSAKGENDDGG